MAANRRVRVHRPSSSSERLAQRWPSSSSQRLTRLRAEPRANRKGWFALFLALMVVGLVTWGVFEVFDGPGRAAFFLGERADNAAVGVYPPVPDAPREAEVAPPLADGAAPSRSVLPLYSIVNTPDSYAGEAVAGTAMVDEVVSERGFWLEKNGDRIFAVVFLPDGRVGTPRFDEGQQLRFSGTITAPQDVERLGARLESESARVARDEPAFLTIEPGDVDILHP